MRQNDIEVKATNINPLLNDHKFQQFLICSQIAVLYLDKTGNLLFATPYIQKIIGAHNINFGHSITDSELTQISPDLTRIVSKLSIDIKDAEQNDKKRKLKFILKRPIYTELTGMDNITYQVIIHTYPSQDNSINGIILTFHDISERKAAEKAIELEKERYKLISELTECALWEYDIEKKEMRQYRKLKGRYSNENLTMKDYRSLMIEKGWINPDDITLFHDYCDSMDRGDANIHYEMRVIGDNYEYIWVRYQASCLKDANGKAHLIVGRTLNIDKERKEYEKLLQKSLRDPLTGLYNRNATKEKIESCFKHSKAFDKHAVHNFMILDIDNFKQANDVWGHLFGDILLENFAKKLEEILDSTDIAGRIGGDEFVVLQQGVTGTPNIEATAKLICDMAKQYLKGMMIDDTITVSIGIATYPKDGKDYDTLYKKADMALYYAKAKGKDQYAFYSPKVTRLKRKSAYLGEHWVKANLIDQTTPEFEKRLLNYAVDIVNRSNDFNVAIQKILQEIGKYYDLSRIVIIEKQRRSNRPIISYEWCNADIPLIDISNVALAGMGKLEFNHLFQDRGVFYLDDIDTADIVPDMRRFYKLNRIKSIVQCAIYNDEKHVGTISFEDCATRSWEKRELDTLYTMTKLISTYINQLNNKSLLDSELFFTQATLNNQKLCNYAVTEGTYRLVYFSDYTKKQYPNVELGELCYQSIYGKKEPCDPCPLNGLCDGRQSCSIEAYNNDTNAWYSSTASGLVSTEGQSIGMITTSDVTGFIDRVNSKDPMTGLLTLSKFEAEGMRLIAENDQKQYLVVYCDFDKFKSINDEWGYSTGNEILTRFAEMANDFIGEDELFCRITADIFVMLLTYQTKEEVFERISTCYYKITKNFKESFPGINIVIISGIYLLTSDDKILSLAIDRANVARKTVKGTHKSIYAIYDKSLHEKTVKESMIEHNMHNALKNNEFIVYMQPKIDLQTLKIIGAEALVRWRLPDGKIMGPNEFIPIFEKNGFIAELDFYVYEATMRTLRRWLDQNKKPIVVSVNVSRMHLEDSNFMERLEHLLDKYNIPSNLIELEITESMFLYDLDRLRFFVNNLRKKGFIISIDDFGSGYSALNLLKNLPIDILKLDREFFMSNTMEEQDKLIISGIISLAKALGLKVLSEGVETVEQLEFIKSSSCDMAQGYLFYRPMPIEEFEQLIE
ncbi:MAG: MorA [Herbinix sp.]|jgi:diguanylate cyclase (GGDEF)-like protein|nr:MorA [Herbinix sp.]